jgi:hypothetical protein
MAGGLLNMKRPLALALLLALGFASPLCAQKPGDRIYEISRMLSATFEGTTPGNHLRLGLQPIALEPSHPYDLFLAVSGKFEQTNVILQGVIRLETQGPDIYFTYIPHFSSLVTALSNDAGRFTERELSSACSFVMKPSGDGFVGNTLGTTTCALAIRGAIGKWSIEIDPGGLRLRNVDTGETLRFKQTGK